MNTKQQPMPVDLAESAWCYHVGRDDAKKLWAAMLAAAPQPLPLHNVGGELTAPAGTASDNNHNC